MSNITRTGRGVWSGDLRGGQGRLSLGSGVLEDEPYSFKTRFKNAPGTNPDELIAAAHAACYSMAFAGALSEKGYEPEAIETHATITLEPVDGGFKISKMHLEVRGRVPEIDQDTFQRVADEADKGCPVSNLLRPGLEIEREATLT